MLRKISQMEENGSSQEDGFDDYYVQDIKFGEFSEIESQSSESEP